ncbi:hypothetical protein BH10ACI4_BH10ACI4_07960 [soil metagenome]
MLKAAPSDVFLGTTSHLSVVIPKDKHVQGNHKKEMRNKNWTQTQTVKNAFSLFKRGIVGNYHQLSREHLDRYLSEFCWRYNRRHQQPRFDRYGPAQSG